MGKAFVRVLSFTVPVHELKVRSSPSSLSCCTKVGGSCFSASMAFEDIGMKSDSRKRFFSKQANNRRFEFKVKRSGWHSKRKSGFRKVSNGALGLPSSHYILTTPQRPPLHTSASKGGLPCLRESYDW